MSGPELLAKMIQDRSGGRGGQEGTEEVADNVSQRITGFYSKRNEKALGRGCYAEE